MKRDPNTTIEVRFMDVPMTADQKEACQFADASKRAAGTLCKAIKILTPKDGLDAGMDGMNDFELNVVDRAVDILRSVWASVTARSDSEKKMESRSLSRGEKVKLASDVGNSDDDFLETRMVDAKVIAVDGATALVAFLHKEDLGDLMYYVLVPQYYLIPKFYSQATQKHIEVIVHCAPDAIIWALDVGISWMHGMTKADQNNYQKACETCEQILAKSRETRTDNGR